MDDLLDSDEPCCNWEAVAKRKDKEIKHLKEIIEMHERTMQDEVQFVAEFRKPETIHAETQTDKQVRLYFYALVEK